MNRQNEVTRKRIFTWIPENVHRAVKITAAKEGVTIQDWLEQAIIERMEKGDRESSVIPFHASR